MAGRRARDRIVPFPSKLALAIALIFDAVTDPLAGSLSDNWKSRLGRRHPFMYASAIPLALAFVGLFSLPQELGEWGLFLWCYSHYNLSRARHAQVLDGLNELRAEERRAEAAMEGGEASARRRGERSSRHPRLAYEPLEGRRPPPKSGKRSLAECQRL